MRIVKILLGLFLLAGCLMSIPKTLSSGLGFAPLIGRLIPPIIVLIIAIWLLKSGLSKSKK